MKSTSRERKQEDQQNLYDTSEHAQFVYAQKLPEECCLFQACIRSSILEECRQSHPEFVFSKSELIKIKFGDSRFSSYHDSNPSEKKVIRLRLNRQSTEQNENTPGKREGNIKKIKILPKPYCPLIHYSSNIKFSRNPFYSNYPSLNCTYNYVYQHSYDPSQEIVLFDTKLGELHSYKKCKNSSRFQQKQPLVLDTEIAKCLPIIAKKSNRLICIFILRSTNDRRLQLYTLNQDGSWLLESDIEKNVADFDVINISDQKRLYLLLFLGKNVSIIRYSYQSRSQVPSFQLCQHNVLTLHHDPGISRVAYLYTPSQRQFTIFQIYRSQLRSVSISMEIPSELEVIREIRQVPIEEYSTLQPLLFLKLIRVIKANYIAIGQSSSVCQLIQIDLSQNKIIRFKNNDLLDVWDNYTHAQNRYILFLSRRSVILFDALKNTNFALIEFEPLNKCLVLFSYQRSETLHLIYTDELGNKYMKKLEYPIPQK